MTLADIRRAVDQPGGYRLSERVYATREGLIFEPFDPYLWRYVTRQSNSEDCDEEGKALWLWPEVARRLQYQKGQSWCRLPKYALHGNGGFAEGYTGYYAIESPAFRPDGGEIALNVIAAILCCDGASLYVLHWCITELGG